MALIGPCMPQKALFKEPRKRVRISPPTTEGAQPVWALPGTEQRASTGSWGVPPKAPRCPNTRHSVFRYEETRISVFSCMLFVCADH